MAATLEIHLEDWYHALTDPCTWNTHQWRLNDTMPWVLDTLRRQQVTATFYVVGWLADHGGNLLRDIAVAGHRFGSHGYYHRHGEQRGDGGDFSCRVALHRTSARWGVEMNTNTLPYRSPFWDSTPRPGYGGGVFFRALPYAIVKREVERTGICYLHPHDLDPGHPHAPFVPWRRYVGLATARAKLERLLQEVDFERR